MHLLNRAIAPIAHACLALMSPRMDKRGPITLESKEFWKGAHYGVVTVAIVIVVLVQHLSLDYGQYAQ